MKKPFCFVDYISDETNYYIKWYLESSNEETQKAESSLPGGKQQPPATKKPKPAYPEEAAARNYLIFMITTSYPQLPLAAVLTVGLRVRPVKDPRKRRLTRETTKLL